MDLEELQEMNSSDTHAISLNAKEMKVSKSGEKFIFPVADGTVKPFGGDQALKISTLTRNQPVLEEKVTMTSWENQEGLHLQIVFKTHIRMPVKHDMVSSPFREASYTAISLNHESNSSRQ